MEHEPTVVRPEDRDRKPEAAAGGDIYSTLATGKETDGSYFLTHAIVPAGGGPPPHIHTREEEAFYIIDGELTFLVGSDRITVGAGTFLNVPKGAKHQFHNRGASAAEMLFWFAPAGIEGLFRELGERPEEIIEIGNRYGVEYFLDE